MTLKERIYKILLENSSARNSDKILQWEILYSLGLIVDDTLSHDSFMKAPEFESVRRCRQALQRTDLLTGAKLIQPNEVVKKQRVNMSKEKGYTYMQGKQQYTFNPVTQCYE